MMRGVATNQRGVVLITGLILIAMLIILLTSLFRTSALSIAHAASLRSADRAFQAAEDALYDALTASVFIRAQPPDVTTTLAHDVSVTTRVEYLGQTPAIPHPAYQPALHGGLRAHFFVATAEARGRRSAVRRHQLVFYVIADAATPPRVALARPGPLVAAAFGSGIVAVSWRSVPA